MGIRREIPLRYRMADFVQSWSWFVPLFFYGLLLTPIVPPREPENESDIVGRFESAGSELGNRYGLPGKYANVRLTDGRLITVALPRHAPLRPGQNVRIRVMRFGSNRVRYSFAGYFEEPEEAEEWLTIDETP